MPDVPVVEVQAARAEDLRREVELLLPVVDDRAAEEALRPRVHLARDLLGDRQEHRVAMDGQLQVALVVERHRRDLAERILAVEHPAVGAGQQRVGDVADAVLDRRVRLGRGAGALNPLPLQIRGISLPIELAVAGVLHLDRSCARSARAGSRNAIAPGRARAPERRAMRAAITLCRSSSN